MCVKTWLGNLKINVKFSTAKLNYAAEESNVPSEKEIFKAALALPYQDRVNLLVILLGDLRKERAAAEKKAGRPLPDWPKRQRSKLVKRSRT